MSDDIFGSASTQTTTTTQPATQDVGSLLATIKNDSGEQKYQTVEDALKALQHSQQYIPELKTKLSAYEQQIADAQAQLEKASKIDDVLARLAAGTGTGDGGDNHAAPGLDEQTVIQLVQTQLAELETKKLARSNADVVKATLTTKYGDKTAEVVQAKAAELGTTAKLLGDLAEKSPQLVLSLFGAPTVQNLNPSKSSVSVPPINKPSGDVQKPTKSILSGSTAKEQAAHFAEHRKAIYEKYGVTT